MRNSQLCLLIASLWLMTGVITNTWLGLFLGAVFTVSSLFADDKQN